VCVLFYQQLENISDPQSSKQSQHSNNPSAPARIWHSEIVHASFSAVGVRVSDLASIQMRNRRIKVIRERNEKGNENMRIISATCA
jgi:hypothetical protein